MYRSLVSEPAQIFRFTSEVTKLDKHIRRINMIFWNYIIPKSNIS